MFRSIRLNSIQRNCCEISACSRFVTQQRYFIPGVSRRTEQLPKPEPGFQIYYQGNLTPYLKMLKTFSMSTTISGILVYYFAATRLGLIDKTPAAFTSITAVASVVILSPLFINLMARRYVAQLTFNPETKVFTVNNLNIFNQMKTLSFTADQVNTEINRPLTTFMVGRKPFFVDPLQFSDISIYEHLMGYDKIKHLIEEEHDTSKSQEEHKNKTDIRHQDSEKEK